MEKGEPWKQLVTNDLEGQEDLHNRFADGSEVYINACQVANGETFAQTMAESFGSTVFAYGQNLKFFQIFVLNSFSPLISLPYDGGREFNTSDFVEMSPYIGKDLTDYGIAIDFSLPLPISPRKFVPR
jgi:hypothetical protein